MAIDKITVGTVTGLQTELDNSKINPTFTGTEAAKMPTGTTAQRANVTAGDIRFNSTISLMEYYDGTLWKAIDSPPTIASISPTTFTAAGDTITITGTNFQTGVNIRVVGSDGTSYTPDSVTRASSSSITFDITTAIFNSGLDAFDVKVENASGLSSTNADALTIPNPTATFNNSATQTIYNSMISSNFDAGVTLSGDVSESDVTLTFAKTSGTLPTGSSLNTSTGAITSIGAVGSDTTSNFTITATIADASEGTSVVITRAFALTVAAPVITSYTSTGSGTFSVPSGLSLVDVLVVAGGGSYGNGNGSTGGGGGGLIYRPAFPITPGGSISYSVGAGTAGQPGSTSQPNAARQPAGQDSTFGTLTAKGGGSGGAEKGTGPSAYNPFAPSYNAGGAGGSGGGSTRTGQGTTWRGLGIQPQQSGDSGTYGFGNPGGGDNDVPGQHTGGGGGGAGSAGTDATSPSAQTAPGGNGRQYGISGSQVYYAGGGSGSAYNQGQGTPYQPGSGGQGGGGQAGGPNPNNHGLNNRGGGGAAGNGLFTGGGSGYGGGNGGSGIVIVSY
jgi:hypothetical protein